MKVSRGWRPPAGVTFGRRGGSWSDGHCAYLSKEASNEEDEKRDGLHSEITDSEDFIRVWNKIGCK